MQYVCNECAYNAACGLKGNTDDITHRGLSTSRAATQHTTELTVAL